MEIEEGIVFVKELSKEFGNDYDYYLSVGDQEQANRQFKYYKYYNNIGKWLEELKAIHNMIDDLKDVEEMFNALRKKINEINTRKICSIEKQNG